MATITSLHPELFIGICHDFELSDLCAVRLTCKALRLRTTEYFAKRVFKAIHVAITSEGMQFMRKTAAPDFRLYLQELWIVTDLFDRQHNLSADAITEQQKRYPVKSPESRKRSLGFECLPAPEAPIEDCHAIYQDAVADHLRTNHTLRETLESCLSCFPNLGAIGLWNPEGFYGVFSKERIRRKIRGVGKLKRLLGFDPLNLEETARSRRVPRNSAAILSTLLAALATTNTRIQKLDTDGGYPGPILANTRPHLTEAERDLLTPILHGLQDMTLCIFSSLEEDKNEFNVAETHQETIMSILAEGMPNLDNLTISQSPRGVYNQFRSEKRGLGIVNRHVDWMSRHFSFRHLSALKLSNMIFTMESLAAFLESALPTLRKLELQMVTITSERVSKSLLLEEGMKVWRQFCVFLRDNSSLKALDLSFLVYQEERIGINDPVHGYQGMKPLLRVSNHARYRETRSDILFSEWIDQVKFRSFLPPKELSIPPHAQVRRRRARSIGSLR